MKINPQYETVNCGPLGYPDIDVDVRINPTGAQVDAYFDFLRRLIGASNDEERDAAEADYETAVVALLREVRQGDETWLMESREDLARFGQENDPQIIAYALSELWERRARRVENARASFRAAAS